MLHSVLPQLLRILNDSVVGDFQSLTCFERLELLEASSIAWPNATMWRQLSVLPPHQFSGIENCGYLERHGSVAQKVTAASHKAPAYDPFTEPPVERK